ncbi:ABC transporter permease subunit [Falsochrobactrum sp. TDYN1]|uniref:ABC transporter permease subunit n=1 Tax=Falsochrobactrum tianjinense TaxID=2706015 RepID=A0A949UUM0_9HYPH|nr:ABC transporter permease subunit [Falsochrobactrum sp. TDYN1]MBV2143476.1 ABC transporter permease subunit [Falsochrobactrum sp. TDYN1]
MIKYIEIMVGQGWANALLFAALTTILVSLFAFILGTALGSLLAWGRIGGSRPVQYLTDLYITVLRGIPELLVIYVFYFGGSAFLSMIGEAFGNTGFIGMPALAVGAIAIGLVSAAYQAEVFRGAFSVMRKGELEAAYAIGMRNSLVFRRIIVPQVMRIALPGLGNCWQIAVKESALVSVTGLVELLRQAMVGAGSTQQPFYFYFTAAALYLAITVVSMWGFDRAEKSASRSMRRA